MENQIEEQADKDFHEQRAIFNIWTERGFDTRSANAYVYLGITEIEQLVVMTEAELLRLPNYGRKSLNLTNEILAARGLALTKEVHVGLEEDCPDRTLGRLHAKLSHHLFQVANLRKAIRQIEAGEQVD